MPKDRQSNRLINEKSPYLQQHAYNPVNWYPWSDEAFEIAAQNDRPIFLSIGYSTCHWCHVMEKESFEDPEIASLMNSTFINIKVDREERPDIDGIYMSVCQLLTGSGGWPLTIIMTADKKPFFAGTYFPKESNYGRIGMRELIPKIDELWNQRRQDVLNSANSISSNLGNIESGNNRLQVPEEIIKRAKNELSSSFDWKFGGFRNAPKFPVPHNLTYLLRYYKLTGDAESLEMVEKTLSEMRQGGIYDHIGFGFHRYSTDRKWFVPHFEKMLYDQALLISAYTEAYLVTKSEHFKNTALETAEYVIRDLTSEEGAFYSAEDADSEGIEGKFYLWSLDEIRSIIGGDADLFSKYYSILEKGNYSGESEVERSNILSMQFNHIELSKIMGFSPDELEGKLKPIRSKLFEYREKRVKPYKDDKVLTDWNGLAISSLATAGAVFGEEKLINAAKRAAEFVLRKLKTSNGRLLHRYRDGDSAINAMIDDYSFFIQGLLSLYDATFEIEYLQNAIELIDIMIDDFWDNDKGGFYFTSNNAELIIYKRKELYDGAIPSGNSVALEVLLKLWKISSDERYLHYSDKLVKAFIKTVGEMPSVYTKFVSGLIQFTGYAPEIVIVSNDADDNYKEFARLINSHFIPDRVVILKNRSNEEYINKLCRYTENMDIVENKTIIYYCNNFSCSLPIDNIDKFEKLLEAK